MEQKHHLNCINDRINCKETWSQSISWYSTGLFKVEMGVITQLNIQKKKQQSKTKTTTTETKKSNIVREFNILDSKFRPRRELEARRLWRKQDLAYQARYVEQSKKKKHGNSLLHIRQNWKWLNLRKQHQQSNPTSGCNFCTSRRKPNTKARTEG